MSGIWSANHTRASILRKSSKSILKKGISASSILLLAVHKAHNSLDCFSSKDKVLFVMLIELQPSSGENKAFELAHQQSLG